MSQNMTLKNVTTLKLLPPWMRSDEANIALAKAMDTLFRDPGSRLKQLRTWDQIDELGDEELDELAWELDIDWYSSTMSIDRKRATVKVASQVKEKRGTKWAVEQLISAYFGPGYVEEWFENDGDPYTFKVLTTNPDISDDNFAEFIRQVNAAKSERSHMDGVFFFEEISAAIIVAPTSEPHIFEHIKCGTRPHPATVGAIDKTAILAYPSATKHGFEYTHAGDGTITGTYPDTATLGQIKDGNIAVDPTADPMGFNYGTHAGDGTATGTYPNTMRLGELVQAAVEAAGEAEAQSFNYQRKAGKTPRTSTIGERSINSLETGGATRVRCFSYTKCGTAKCGE